MNWLISTDLHLSDRARDEYRFGLFGWLRKEQRKHKVDVTFLLGDMTESKDRHSSTLVNRIVEELLKLQPPVYILRGNHDGLSPESPFFKFLNSIPGLTFVVKPTFLHKYEIAMIPHCRTQEELNTACKQMPANCKAVFLHQTFTGAIAETGMPLPGLDLSPVNALKPWLGAYSGDVHVPQRQNGLTYVGAPYHVRFGDKFKPRILLIKGGGKHDLHFDCPRKYNLTIKNTDDLLNHEELRAGDQVKITVELEREELIGWQELKRNILATCHKQNVDVFGIDCAVQSEKKKPTRQFDAKKEVLPRSIFDAFCQSEELADNIRQAGIELL